MSPSTGSLRAALLLRAVTRRMATTTTTTTDDLGSTHLLPHLQSLQCRGARVVARVCHGVHSRG
jgi:hypothetical protein